jgi:uncharacterized protein YndB with AHSA1/START domain
MTKSDPVIITQDFNNSIIEVWGAITQLEQMTQWFFEEIPAFRPEVGFFTQFNIKTPEREFLHLWRIIEVIPFRKIVYDWRYKDYSGESTVSFELFEQANQTHLKLSTEGLETYSQNIPEFTRESCTNGWIYFINNRLKNYLEQKKQAEALG